MGSVKKNFLYNVVYQILVILLPLITAPYITRALGATAVGIYSYTNSVAYYFLMAAMLGISNHGNRSVASVRDDPKKLNYVFSSIFSLQFLTFTVAIIGYIIYIFLFCQDNKTIAALQVFYVLSGLFDVSWLFFGLEKFKLTVTRNIFIKLGTVLCMFIFVHTPDDLWRYTLIMSLGTLFSQMYLWIYVNKYVKIERVGIRGIFENLKPVLVLFIPVLAYSVYKVMDKIMLGNMSTYAEVGYYQNAEKIVNIPMGIITAFGTVMLPRMSNIVAKGDTEKTEHYIKISIKLVTVLCSAIAFGLMGISEVLAPVYFGKDFSVCSSVIMLLSITVFFIAWANVVRTQYLIPCHYDRVYIFSTAIGAILNLIINYALIPKMQSNGAAIGTIVAEFSVMFVQMFAVRKKLPVLEYFKSVMPIIFIGFVMSGVVWVIGNNMGVSIATLVIQILVGGSIFLPLLIIYLFLTKDELWKFFLTLVKERRKDGKR